MRKPNLTERQVYGKIVTDAANIAGRRLLEENYMDNEGTVQGSFTLDNRRQPTFRLEPLDFYAEYEWPEGVGDLLDDCIHEAINQSMSEFLAIALANAWSTPSNKIKATLDDEQGTLF